MAREHPRADGLSIRQRFIAHRFLGGHQHPVELWSERDPARLPVLRALYLVVHDGLLDRDEHALPVNGIPGKSDQLSLPRARP